MFLRALTIALAMAAFAAAGPSASAAAAKTLYVSATATSDPACATASQLNPFATIAGALKCAGNGTVVMVGAGRFDGGFTVSHNVTLEGAAAAAGTVISNPGAAQQSLTEVTDAPGTVVTLRDLTIDGGTNQANNVIGQRDIVAGAGSLSLINVDVENGLAYEYPGVNGGGVSMVSTTGPVALTLLDSSVDDNAAVHGAGVQLSGPAAAANTLVIADTTIAGNSSTALSAGAGVDVSGAHMMIDSSTVTANTNSNGGTGGLQLSTSTATITNTLIAGNHSSGAPDCLAGSSTLQSGGHNLVGIDDPQSGDACATFLEGQHFDQVGSSAAPIDPKLGPLAEHGGLTPTIAPLAGSPALNAGDPAACASAPISGLDQRHVARGMWTRWTCDIGAYDTATPANTLYVMHSGKADPSCAAASQAKPFATIAGALACSGDGTLVKIGAGQFTGGFTVSRNVTLQGSTAAGATVISNPQAGQQSLTEVTVAPGADVSLRGLTIDGGTDQAKHVIGQRDIVAGAGSLSLINVNVENGLAYEYPGLNGGGVSMMSSTGPVSLALFDSTVDGNAAVQGSGVQVAGPEAVPNQLVIDNSTIAGNSNSAEFAGAGVDVSNAQVTIDGSTITANVNSNSASAGLELSSSTATLTNTLLAGNHSAGQPDCSAAQSTIRSGGHNVIGINHPQPEDACASLVNGQHSDQVGTLAAPIDPKVGPLAENGGVTPTAALLAGSPAIGTGDPVACKAAPISGRDQRHMTRSATCDVGAYDTGAVS